LATAKAIPPAKNMIVFKHNHVVQGKPVILSSTHFTAHSATRKPGVVLRVSSILVFVPSSNLTKLWLQWLTSVASSLKPFFPLLK
jgi:hypothetical protein